MKRIIALLIGFVLVFSLAACETEFDSKFEKSRLIEFLNKNWYKYRKR